MQNLYINNWFKKIIKLISDLLDINGNLYHFDVFKEMYGVNSIFLDYQSLNLIIPNYWKNMIINNRLVCIETKYNVTCNIYVQFLLKEKRDVEHFTTNLYKWTKGSLTVWALYAYFSDSQNAAFELLV